MNDSHRLHDRTRNAAAITGWPAWASPVEPGAGETLTFLERDPETGEPAWVLRLDNDPTGEADTPVAPAVAATLLKAHFQEWLAAGGWQVQLSVRGGNRIYRLVDALAVVDGGGDRIDDDYPAGEDELRVLCDAVRVAAKSARTNP